MSENPMYTGLPPLPQPERSDPLADNQGYTVGKQEEMALERDIQKEEQRRQQERKSKRNQYDSTGNKRPGCGCRLIGLGCAGILLLLLAFGAYIIFSRPPQIVNPAKEWLNNGLEPKSYDLLSQEPVDRFNDQLGDFRSGENTVVLDEEQLNILINRKIANSRVNIDVQQDVLKMYLDVTPDAEVPLWFVVNFAVDPQDKRKLIIDGIGTERFSTPDFLNQIILDTLLSANSAIGVAGGGNDADDFLDLIIRFDSAATIEGLDITDDELVLTIDFNTGLENLFE